MRALRDLLVPVPSAAVASSGSSAGARPLLITRRAARNEQLVRSFGAQAEVRLEGERPEQLPDSVTAVIVARAAGEQLPVARRLLAEGRHVVCTADDPTEVAELLGLDEQARDVGRTVVVGAAMSPGLSCLLAAHARGLLDEVDEVHVARHGAAGPACARQRLRALRGTALDWRDHAWVRRPGFSGRELDWFPDPIGARDCYRAELAEPLLLQPAFPTASRITARLAASRRDRALAPFPVLVPPPSEGGLGAVRVELRGTRAGQRASVIYGALDRPAVVAAALAAVVARRLLVGDVAPGAFGVAQLDSPLELLVELARRGVRAATLDVGSASDLAS